MEKDINVIEKQYLNPVPGPVIHISCTPAKKEILQKILNHSELACKGLEYNIIYLVDKNVFEVNAVAIGGRAQYSRSPHSLIYIVPEHYLIQYLAFG